VGSTVMRAVPAGERTRSSCESINEMVQT
jgi:hypothetical protein